MPVYFKVLLYFITFDSFVLGESASFDELYFDYF